MTEPVMWVNMFNICTVFFNKRKSFLRKNHVSKVGEKVLEQRRLTSNIAANNSALTTLLFEYY